MISLDAEGVKKVTRQLGADLVGIASAQVLNESPPDPRWPQTPARLWQECRSVIVIAKHMPWGVYRSKGRVNRLGAPHLVLAKLDQIGLELTYYLEDRGCYAVSFYGQALDIELKKGTYGSLSLRHVAAEAGLGTLGLNMMLLTPQYGPRIYLTCVLTSAVLEPDNRMQEQLCLGPTCGRCLLACPSDAVRHWGLDKHRCGLHAEVYGYPQLLNHLGKIIEAKTWEQRQRLIQSVETANFYEAAVNAVGSFAGCLRCTEVCPVGDDYNLYLRDRQARIPEATLEKQARLEEMQVAERSGQEVQGEAVSKRWIGGKRHPIKG